MALTEVPATAAKRGHGRPWIHRRIIMVDIQTLQRLFEYNDWADGRLLECAGPLDDERLDRRFDIGPGSLRRTLLHIFVGEDVWVRRCSGHSETRWTGEDEPAAVNDIAARFKNTWAARDALLATLTN